MLSEESSVFVAGSLVLMAWLLAVAVLCPLGGLWDQWVIMEFTELLLGRGVAIAKGVALGGLLTTALVMGLRVDGFPRSVFLIGTVLTLLLLAGARASWRTLTNARAPRARRVRRSSRC